MGGGGGGGGERSVGRNGSGYCIAIIGLLPWFIDLRCLCHCVCMWVVKVSALGVGGERFKSRPSHILWLGAEIAQVVVCVASGRA